MLVLGKDVVDANPDQGYFPPDESFGEKIHLTRVVATFHLTRVVVTPSPGSTIPPGKLHTPLSRRCCKKEENADDVLRRFRC